mgnify:CR=1 FL=1
MSDTREMGCDEAYGLQGTQQSHRTGEVGLRGVSGQRRTDHYCKCKSKSDRSMTDTQIFSNPQFGEIRTLADEASKPLFCAADVCNALGYSNPRDAISRHVDEGDVVKRDTPTTSGVQTITFVNESGLYSLIFHLRKQARQRKGVQEVGNVQSPPDNPQDWVLLADGAKNICRSSTPRCRASGGKRASDGICLSMRHRGDRYP